MTSATVVLLAGPGESTALVYNALVAAGLPVAHVIIEEAVPHRQLLARRVRTLGRLTVLGQVGFQGLLVPLLRRRSAARRADILAQHGLNPTAPPPHLTTQVASVNAPETQRLLEQYQPTLVVVNGTRIIARRVLASVAVPFINTHAGITPQFRGVHGGYWALAERRPASCGVTVHYVDPGIDTGQIIAQARIAPTAADCFVTYPYLQLAAGLPLLTHAVQRLLADEPLPPATSIGTGPSRLWSHPTLWGYLWRRWRYAVR